MDVLRALHKTAITIKPGELEEISRQESWESGQNVLNEIQFFSDGLAEQVMSSETLARLSQDAFQVDSMMSILKALTEAALGLKKIFDKCLKPVIRQLAKAITTLPDELLALIFKFATLQEGTRQAIHLSHVSNRFRRVALEEHVLWSTLHSSSKKEKLEASIARSGHNTDLHVIIHINKHYFDVRTFMNVCSLTTPRWKTLAISESDDMRRRAGPTGDEVLKTMSRYNDVQFLRLHEPHITDYRSNAALEDDDELRFKRTWHFPNLRILSCKGYVPPPSSSSSSISSFSNAVYISPLIYADQLEEIFTFLTSTPAITDLDLQIVGLSGCRMSEPIQFGLLTCRSVTSLNFCLPRYSIDPLSNKFIAAFMRAFHAPNLEQMTMSIDFYAMDLMARDLEEDRSTELLAKLAQASLPDPIAHGRLTSLAFKLTCEIPQVDPSMMMRTRKRILNLRTLPRTLTIPLDRIPNVTSLTLTTFARTLFARGGSSDSCRLRELHFRKCESMDAGLLQETIQSLKDVGAWDTLERIAVEDCKVLEYGVALDAVGREKLRFLNL